MDFNVDDFLPACDKCGGSGRAPAPASDSSRQGGIGSYSVKLHGGEVKCDKCNGRKYIPTEAGKKVMELLKRVEAYKGPTGA